MDVNGLVLVIESVVDHGGNPATMTGKKGSTGGPMVQMVMLVVMPLVSPLLTQIQLPICCHHRGMIDSGCVAICSADGGSMDTGQSTVP